MTVTPSLPIVCGLQSVANLLTGFAGYRKKLQQPLGGGSRHQNIKNCHIEKSEMPAVNAIDDNNKNNNSKNYKEELNTKISLVAYKISLSVLIVEYVGTASNFI